MRKVLSCVLSLVVGLALFQLAGCKKSEPGAKPGQPGPAAKPEQPGASAKPEQPGPAAKPDPLAAAAKKLAGVWNGKPPMPEGEKKGPPMDVTMTVEFKDGGAMSVAMGPFPTMNGTWEVVKAEGNNVTVKSVMEMPDLGALAGKEKQAKPQKETEELLIVFLTDDRITMSPTKDPKDVGTLDRQKK